MPVAVPLQGIICGAYSPHSNWLCATFPLVVEACQIPGFLRKVETVLVNDDTASFTIWQPRAGAIACKNICIKPLQEKTPTEAGEEATTAQTRKVDDRREEWEHQNGAVLDEFILSGSNPAEAVVRQFCGRGVGAQLARCPPSAGDKVRANVEGYVHGLERGAVKDCARLHAPNP